MRQLTLSKRFWLTSQPSGQPKSYHPQLYVLKTKVYKDGQLVDVTEDTFGCRYFNWTVKEGFSLNGEHIKFHGVSLHHDHGALGAEENYRLNIAV